MARRSLVILFITLLPFYIHAQNPQKLNPSQIHESIQKLNFLGSVLYVAAHPDDENTRLISYMSNHMKARTAYLSMTRGDGGQNLIGPEIRELLGVIRTQELLTARNIDGGEQLFTRANDFGYSKHPNETLEIWNKEAVLSDVVWAIRKFRPDVIINRFNHRTPGTTHGHHTSSAMLSVDAFDLVGDKKKYPDQLQHTDIWQPKRLFFNTSWWFYGSEEKFAKADKSNFLSFDIGTYYPALGLSNTEIASLSRSQHKSQGFGNTGTRGSSKEYIELIKGLLPKDKTNIFEGIDTSWNRVSGGKAIGVLLTQIEKEFDFRNPASSLPKLMQVYQLISKLEDQHWKDIKLAEIKAIITASMGLYLEVAATDQYVAQTENINVNIEAINRSDVPIKLLKVHSPLKEKELTINEVLTNNEGKSWKMDFTPREMELFSPYWLQEKGTLGMYKVDDPKLIGLPNTPEKYFYFNLEIEGTPITIKRPLIYKTNDPVKGEVYKPFEIVPEVSVGLGDKVLIFTTEKSRQIPVKIKANKENIKGTVTLNIPDKWTITPKEAAFDLTQKGEEQSLIFTLTPPAEQNEGLITPIVEINGKKYQKELLTIDYDHIPFQSVLLPSEAKVVRLDISKKGENIGYIEGAGDVVPESLKQIGYKVTLINPETISKKALQPFDAIVMGIRAYNTVEVLKFKQDILLDYVKNGGNLIVQYNTSRGLKTEKIAPFELKLSRDRVTDEHAPIKVLQSEHPLLNAPNKITQNDFEGWVQERGLYFPSEWGKEFTPLFAIHDKGESVKKGSLLIAKYGKGYYMYTGLSFFREFPAGVPGAYRLFANMLSVGK